MKSLANPGTPLTMTDLFANKALRSYLSNVRDWHGYIRFLGLPDRRDHPDVIVDRLFVEPLVVASYDDVSPDKDPTEWIEHAESLLQAVTVDQPIVLLGDPGAGKSSLVNYLVWLLSRPAENRLVERIGWHLPVPMVLRELRLEDVTDFDGLLQAFLAHAMSEPLRDGTLLTDTLAAGRGFILLDGIDEIADLGIRGKLRRAVFDGFSRYPGCRWLLTSRIVGYEEMPFDRYDGDTRRGVRDHKGYGDSDGARNGYGTDRPVDSLLKQRAAEGFRPDLVVTRYLAPFDDRRIRAFARRWYEMREAAAVRAGEDAARLVEAVHADKAILRLARVPHLLTMMALIHRIEATLPQERALLYDRIAEAYLESIDKFRGIYSGAGDLPFKKRWLARVGYEMQRRRDAQEGTDSSEILVDGDDVVRWVQDEMELHATLETETAEGFLQFVKRRSGLFLPRGEDRYAFIHLSFQEYFAAHAMKREVTTPAWVRDRKSRLLLFDSESLTNWAKESTWLETFVFLFELLVSEDDWYDDLRDCVFGKNFAHLYDGTDKFQSLNVLLSRIVLNRRSRFKPHDVVTEIGRQDKIRIGTLNLSRLQVADLSPLAGITSLEVISLDRTQVTDLSSLAGITSLRNLSLNETQVTDLSPLAGITSLRNLLLNGTQVADLSPLAGITSLRSLSLDRTQVTDLSSLAGITSLRNLSLNGTQVTDLSPLAGITSLRSLSLDRTQVTDLSPLAGITSLEELWLAGTQVTDLSPLAGITSLRNLSLNGTQVTDLSPLAGITSLEVLLLAGIQVTDLSPLASITSLEELWLAGTQVTDLSPLAGITSLRGLWLAGTQITDLSPLAGITSLRGLWLIGFDTPVLEHEINILRAALPDCAIYSH